MANGNSGLSGVQLKDGTKPDDTAKAPLPLQGLGVKDRVSSNEPSEFAIMLSKGIEVKVVKDGVVIPVLIQPFKFMQLDNVVAAVAPVFEQLKDLNKARADALEMVSNNPKLFEFVKNNRTKILTFMEAFNETLTPDFVNDLQPNYVVELIIAIIQVNIDFFIQEATPKLKTDLSRLLVDVLPKLGKSLTE